MKNKIGQKINSHLERSLGGLGVSPGIAFGTAYVRERGAADIPQYRVPKAKLSKEKQRLLMAVELAKCRAAKMLRPATEIGLGHLPVEALYYVRSSVLLHHRDR